MSKVVILAGVPESDAIDWEAVDLLDDFAEPVSRFAGWTAPSLTVDDPTQRQPQPSKPSQPSQPVRPVWRVLSARRGGDAAGGQLTVQPQQQVIGGGHSRPAEHQPYGRAEFLTITQGSSFTTTPGATRTSLQGSASASFETQPLSVRVPQAMPMPSAENVEARMEAHVEMETVSSFEEEGDTTLSQFLEYSLAAHDELPSSLPDLSELWDKKQEGESQGRQDNLIDRGSSSAQGRQKPDRPSAQAVQAQAQPQPAIAVPPKASQVSEHSLTLQQLLPAAFPPLPARWGPLTDLAAVPGAAYLVGIAPQTVTISVVVAVIAVAVPQAVQTRWGGTTSRVEVVVGDETRAGFGVTFWGMGDPGVGRRGRRASDGTTATATMATISSLRPRDVVLLRHVALHTFGNRVYGSSLRRDQTKVHVLLRRGSTGAEANEAEDADAARVLVAKVDRVRAWALRCVGGAGPQLREEGDEKSEGRDGRDDEGGTNHSSGAARPSRERSWDMPPANTQEDGSLINV